MGMNDTVSLEILQVVPQSKLEQQYDGKTYGHDRRGQCRAC
jgi:hypothetical protein